MTPSVDAFGIALRSALASPEPVKRVQELLRDILTTEPAAGPPCEGEVVRRIAERMDASNGTARRLVALAKDVERLIEGSESCTNVETLFEVFVERERTAGIVSKFVNGPITRTGFLSFIAEQPWSSDIRARVAELSTDDLRVLAAALQEPDIKTVERLLVPS